MIKSTDGAPGRPDPHGAMAVTKMEKRIVETHNEDFGSLRGQQMQDSDVHVEHAGLLRILKSIWAPRG